MMSISEFREWQAYFYIEPFGSLRDNYHSAQIAHILANQNRPKNKRPIPFVNFFYSDPEEKKRKKANRLAAMFGAISKPREK